MWGRRGERDRGGELAVPTLPRRAAAGKTPLRCHRRRPARRRVPVPLGPLATAVAAPAARRGPSAGRMRAKRERTRRGRRAARGRGSPGGRLGKGRAPPISWAPRALWPRCKDGVGVPPNGGVTEVTARPYKGCNIKIGSKREVSTLHGHRRERDLFQGLPGNFPYTLTLATRCCPSRQTTQLKLVVR